VRLASIFVAFFAVGPVCAALEPDLGEPTLRQLVAGGTLSDLRWPNFFMFQAHVARFYELCGYSPVWVRDGAPRDPARAAIRVLENAAAKGLDPEDYDSSRWPARLARLRPAMAQPSDRDVTRFDLALTVSLMRYISDSHLGKVNPKLFHFGLDTACKQCDLTEILFRQVVDAKDVGAVLEQFEPPFPSYWRAQKVLQSYIALAREDSGEPLPAVKKTVEAGDSYPGTGRLRQLLRKLGDLPLSAREPDGSLIYQGALVDAVKRFQARHGLDADGRLGKDTLKQLNVPLSRRVRQLQLTLERFRWVPDEFAHRPIVVNIPEFRLRAFNDRYQTELEMKVVVGRAYHRQTPVFANTIRYIIFRPHWNVPLSIQRTELLSKITKDVQYLAKNDYEVVNSQGDVVSRDVVNEEMLAQLRAGKLAIRQAPGAKNALGYIKFMFPNEYNVYLHGTPSTSLFSRSRRDFSHGCIRVEKPEELAAWVLRDRPEWTLDRIREAENGAKSLQVNLTNPIPVLIVYGTAVVRESGEVCFFEDLYKHDAALEQVLDQGYPYSAWKPTSGGRAPGRRE
jgi:murein L,D-transpeptidase YcbB/YkuD